MANKIIEAVIEELSDHILKYGEEPEGEQNDNRCELGSSLEEFNDPTSLQYLISLISKENGNLKEYEQLKYWIIQAFYEIKSPLTLDILIEVANDKDEEVSATAVETLGHLRDPKAIDVLGELLLSDEDEVIRSEAAKALNLIRDPRAVPILTEFLNNVIERTSEEGYHDDDYDAAQNAIQALAVIAEKAGGIEHQKAVEILLKLFEFDQEDLGPKIVSALGYFRDERAVEPLLKQYDTMISDEDCCGDDQEKIVRALGRIGGEAVKKKLFEDMNKPSNCGSRAFVSALAEAKDERILDLLFVDLVTGGDSVRNDAANALACFSNSLDINRILPLLKHKEKGVRADAIWVLGETYNKQAIPYLVKALKDKHYRARAYAAEALGEMKDESAVEPLVEALKREIIVHEAALKKHNKKQKEEPEDDFASHFEGLFNIINTLNDTTPHRAREGILSAFRNIHNEEAFQLTLDHLKHEMSDLRMMAADVLGYIKDERAIDPLEELIRNEEDEYVHDTAVKALEKLRS